MSLDELVDKQSIDAIKGKDFRIDPNSKYDREEFVKRAKPLFKLERYYSKLLENSSDISALRDLIGIVTRYMPGIPQDNADKLEKDVNLAIEKGDLYVSVGSLAMAQFVQNNLDDLLDKFSDKKLSELVFLNPQFTIFKSDNPTYEKFRKRRDKFFQLQEANKNHQDPSSLIEEEYKEFLTMVPDYEKEFIERNREKLEPGLKQSLLMIMQNEFFKMFRTKDGKKLDREAIKAFIKDNYKTAEDYIKNEIPSDQPREKFKRWDDNLKPMYLHIARSLYKPEEHEQDVEDDPDAVEREEEAEDMGLRT